MAGLVPAIPIREAQTVRQFYVYILASRPGGAIYVGVTNDLVRRVYEHKNGWSKAIPSDTGLIVWFTMKSTRRLIRPSNERRTSSTGRVSGTRLIGDKNDTWRDLYDEIQ
jgi:putative endonuclease